MNKVSLAKILYSLIRYSDSVPISDVKLQKIIFIIDCEVNYNFKTGWKEVFKKNDIFSIEEEHANYEAWRFGPVNREIYNLSNSSHAFSFFKESKLIYDLAMHSFATQMHKEIIMKYISLLKKKSTETLVNFTHSFDEYEDKYKKKINILDNHEISFDEIMKQYRKIKETNKQ